MPLSMQPVVLQQPSMLEPHSVCSSCIFSGGSRPTASNKTAFAEAQNWVNQQVRVATLANEGSKVTAERRAEINRLTVPLVPAGNGVSLIRSQYGDSLQILMAVVGVVLLIACANLANFLAGSGDGTAARDCDAAGAGIEPGADRAAEPDGDTVALVGRRRDGTGCGISRNADADCFCEPGEWQHRAEPGTESASGAFYRRGIACNRNSVWAGTGGDRSAASADEDR